MANISIKKDFEDGQKLFAQQLNNNFETIEMGINSGNKIIWKDDNGAEFQTFRGTTEEIENRPIIDGQTLYNIETGEMLLDTEGSRRTINKPLWNDNSTSEVTSFRGNTAEVAARPIIDGQKLYDIENGDTFLDVGETRKVMNKPLWNGNGAQVQSFRGTTEEIAARPIIDGQTLYNIETGETALDVGGKRISTGAGNVVYIGDEEPQNDATKIWIENDQVLNLGSEVAISSEEPTTQEKVWLKNADSEKNIYIKNNEGVYEKFVIQETGKFIQLTTENSNIQQHWGRYRKNLLRADVLIQGTFNTGTIITSGMPFKPDFPQYCHTVFGTFRFNKDGTIELLNGTGSWGQVMLTFFEFK